MIEIEEVKIGTKKMSEREKEKTFEDGVNIARKIVLDILKKYKEKPSDDLQEDLKNEVNQALDKILGKL